MFDPQVKPHQIKTRIETLVAAQQARGYKPGWVWHKMNKLVEKKWDHVFIYQNRSGGSFLPDLAMYIAEGGEWDNEIESRLQDVYNSFQKDLEEIA